MKKYFLLSILAVVVIACTPKMLLTQSDADRAAQKWSGTTLADLQKGQTLYNTTCNQCHLLHKATEFDETGWNKWVPIMSKKAKISDDSEQLILKYLVTMSSAKK